MHRIEALKHQSGGKRVHGDAEKRNGKQFNDMSDLNKRVYDFYAIEIPCGIVVRVIGIVEYVVQYVHV